MTDTKHLILIGIFFCLFVSKIQYTVSAQCSFLNKRNRGIFFSQKMKEILYFFFLIFLCKENQEKNKEYNESLKVRHSSS